LWPGNADRQKVSNAAEFEAILKRDRNDLFRWKGRISPRNTRIDFSRVSTKMSS